LTYFTILQGIIQDFFKKGCIPKDVIAYFLLFFESILVFPNPKNKAEMPLYSS
jgi:hypothetical protein